VTDEWHRRAVGHALVTALADCALPRGVTRFSAPVSPENEPIRRWLSRIGAVPVHNGYELEYEFPVAALASKGRGAPRSPLHAPLEALQRPFDSRTQIDRRAA
jgi:hypothetical protein